MRQSKIGKILIFFILVACQNSQTEQTKHSSLWKKYADLQNEERIDSPAVADANHLYRMVRWLHDVDSVGSRSEICFMNTKIESLFSLADSFEARNSKILDSLDFLFLNAKIDSNRFKILMDSLALRTTSNEEYSPQYLRSKYFKANCDTCLNSIGISFDEFADFYNKKDKNTKQTSDSISYYGNYNLLDSLYLLSRKGKKIDVEKEFLKLKK